MLTREGLREPFIGESGALQMQLFGMVLKIFLHDANPLSNGDAGSMADRRRSEHDARDKPGAQAIAPSVIYSLFLGRIV